MQLDNQRRGTAFPVMLALNQTAGQADGFLSVQLRQRIFPHKAREYPRVPGGTLRHRGTVDYPARRSDRKLAAMHRGTEHSACRTAQARK